MRIFFAGKNSHTRDAKMELASGVVKRLVSFAMIQAEGSRVLMVYAPGSVLPDKR